MKAFENVIAACSFLLAVNFLSAQTLPPDIKLTSNPIYEKNCAKCHGKSAEGRHFGGPSLVSTSASADDLRKIIADGKGRMPKYSGKLTQEKIDTLVQQIEALNTK